MEVTPPQRLGCGATPPDGSQRHKSEQYGKLQWESKKDEITRLYIDEKLPLKEVMKIMSEEHEFHAT